MYDIKERLLKFHEKSKDVNKHWGDLMPMMAMEEAGELAQAISKLERYEQSGQYDRLDDIEHYEKKEAVIKESADVIIAIAALGDRYGYDIGDIELAIKRTLERQY